MEELSIIVIITLIVTLSDLVLNIFKTISQRKSEKKKLSIEEGKLASTQMANMGSFFSNALGGFGNMISLLDNVKKLMPEDKREEFEKSIKDSFKDINFKKDKE